MSKSVEINCPGCGGETLLVREPVYEGFSKVGERLTCSDCGHAFGSEEEVPFKARKKQTVFTEADRSRDPRVFESDEVRMCRGCRHYVVNPFMQWCGVHKKEVAATDTCPDFAPAEPDSGETKSIL